MWYSRQEKLEARSICSELSNNWFVLSFGNSDSRAGSFHCCRSSLGRARSWRCNTEETKTDQETTQKTPSTIAHAPRCPLTDILSWHTPSCVRGVHSRYQKKAERKQQDLEHRKKEMSSRSHIPSLPRKGSLVPFSPEHMCCHC